MFKWAFKNRLKLNSIINAVWAWEEVDQRLALAEGTRIDRLKAAAQQDCICGHAWPSWAAKALELNKVDPGLFWHTFYMSLHDGRREDKAVMASVGKRGGAVLSDSAARCDPVGTFR